MRTMAGSECSATGFRVPCTEITPSAGGRKASHDPCQVLDNTLMPVKGPGKKRALSSPTAAPDIRKHARGEDGVCVPRSSTTSDMKLHVSKFEEGTMDVCTSSEAPRVTLADAPSSPPCAHLSGPASRALPRLADTPGARALAAVGIANIRDREQRMTPPYRPEAEHIRYRGIIVEWMREVIEDRKLNIGTLHLAVNYLDHCLVTCHIPKNSLQLVALCCILIAAKYYEQEIDIPTIKELNLCTDEAYTRPLIVHMELKVLKVLKWYMGRPTAWDFLEYYWPLCVGDVPHAQSATDMNRQKQELQQTQKYFVDLCLSNYSMRQFLPSRRAVAIAMCCRRVLGARDLWPPAMQLATQQSVQACRSAGEALWAAFQKQRGQSTDTESTVPARSS